MFSPVRNAARGPGPRLSTVVNSLFHAFHTAPGVRCDTEIPSCSPTTSAGSMSLRVKRPVEETSGKV